MDSAQNNPAPTNSINTSEQSIPRILIVDDNEQYGKILTKLLAITGEYTPSLVTCPKEALEVIRNENIDLVLSDMNMPEMSGAELVRACAEIDPLLPVIIMTGLGDDEEIEAACLRAGARYFLSKPVRSKQLLAAIDALYEHAKKIREQRKQLRELQALYAEKEMFLQAYEHFPHAAILTDLKGNILYTNEAFTALYGYEKEEVLNKPPSTLNPGKAEYRERGISDEEYDKLFSEMWNDVLDPQIGYWEGNVYNKTKDERIISVRLIINAIRNRQGMPVGFMALPIDITQDQEREEQVRIECYQALADLAEKRDADTGEHLFRMSEYSRIMGEALGLPRKTVSDMALFAPLHDIGKVGIPDAILLAPRRLSANEFEIMKEHVVIGHRILAERQAFGLAAELARYHHERWDGTGYPDGLKGTDTPVSARILAICDVYDALRSKRPYKEPFTHERAMEIVLEGKGTHFDPELIDLFVKLSDKFSDIFTKYMDEE